MSGIAKPHLIFTGALPAAAAKETVPVEDVKSLEKQDIPSFGVGRPAESRVLVNMKDGTHRSFKFADATARNTSYDNAVTLLSASVAAI